MFEQYLLTNADFRNVSENNKVIGFQVKLRIPYYRGVCLSQVQDVTLVMDGDLYPRDKLRFSVGDHGKFYEMTEDYKETSIPYEELIPFLIQNDFHGVIASEYEGQSSIMDAFPVDEVEQVRRHHVMLRRLLGEV